MLDHIQPLFDLESFENEWMEVGIKFPDSALDKDSSNDEENVAHFLRDTIVSPVLEDFEYDGLF